MLEFKYMNYIIFLIVGGVIGYWLGRKKSSEESFSPMKAGSEKLETMIEKSHEAVEERTEERKERILELMQNRQEENKELTEKIESNEEFKICNTVVDRSPGITCNEVEELLDVSDQTARKYLNELEDENKIVQLGKTGIGVSYILKY